MRKSYPRPEKIDIQQLTALIYKLELDHFAGISMDKQEIHLEFKDDRTKFTTTETKKLDAAIAAYEYKVPVSEIRELRVPLLLEADWRINKAEDSGEDTSELRKYRQALRDITNQDLSELMWPEKPWE